MNVVLGALLPTTALGVAAFPAKEIASVEEFDNVFDSVRHVHGARHTLVEFHAPWCGACGGFSPLLAAAVKQLLSTDLFLNSV